MSMEVNFTNNLDQLIGSLPGDLAQGVDLASERLLALSAEKVPLDLGTLQGSGTTAPTTVAGGDVTGGVIYDTPYATRLHEHPEYTFQGGRQGKYVEEPALENADELGEIIASAVKRG